jgi:hypothetical protein
MDIHKETLHITKELISSFQNHYQVPPLIRDILHALEHPETRKYQEYFTDLLGDFLPTDSISYNTASNWIAVRVVNRAGAYCYYSISLNSSPTH